LSFSASSALLPAENDASAEPEVEAEMAERRAVHVRDLAVYRERLRPFCEAGVVDETGKPLTEDVPKTLPKAPEEPDQDDASLLAELTAARADELRDKLTARGGTHQGHSPRYAERLNVARGQVAECRPLFDPKDTAEPRAIFQL